MCRGSSTVWFRNRERPERIKNENKKLGGAQQNRWYEKNEDMKKADKSKKEKRKATRNSREEDKAKNKILHNKVMIQT